MNELILYPLLLIIGGILASVIVLRVLTNFSDRLNKYLELYPESRGILLFSLKFISWIISGVFFLIFLRWALRILDQGFTVTLIEEAIYFAPKCILGALIILAGYYTSRLIRVRVANIPFAYKEKALFVVDSIIYMTFVFTALYTIGVNILFFLNFYLIVMITIGILAALILSMVIGIPLGLSIYEKTRKSSSKKK